MKLLFDTHHSRRAAERLCKEGHDVLTAADDPVLAELSDEELLRFSTAEERVHVTENAKDFDRIIRGWAASGEHHSGVILTSPRRFHRGAAAYPNNLVVALRKVLRKPPLSSTDWVSWL